MIVIKTTLTFNAPRKLMQGNCPLNDARTEKERGRE